MTNKETLAKIIRIVTVPPVQVCALLLILYLTKGSIFAGVPELLFSLLFLMVISVLAYPLAAVIPYCVALFAAIIWASLVLKRHTPKELGVGSFSAAIAFAFSLLLV